MATKYLLLEKLSQSHPPFQTDEGYLYKYQYNTGRTFWVFFIYLVLLPIILIWGWPEYMSLHRQIATALFYLGGYSRLFGLIYALDISNSLGDSIFLVLPNWQIFIVDTLRQKICSNHPNINRADQAAQNLILSKSQLRLY